GPCSGCLGSFRQSPPARAGIGPGPGVGTLIIRGEPPGGEGQKLRTPARPSLGSDFEAPGTAPDQWASGADSGRIDAAQPSRSEARSTTIATALPPPRQSEASP